MQGKLTVGFADPVLILVKDCWCKSRHVCMSVCRIVLECAATGAVKSAGTLMCNAYRLRTCVISIGRDALPLLARLLLLASCMVLCSNCITISVSLTKV